MEKERIIFQWITEDLETKKLFYFFLLFFCVFFGILLYFSFRNNNLSKNIFWLLFWFILIIGTLIFAKMYTKNKKMRTLITNEFIYREGLNENKTKDKLMNLVSKFDRLRSEIVNRSAPGVWAFIPIKTIREVKSKNENIILKVKYYGIPWPIPYRIKTNPQDTKKIEEIIQKLIVKKI